MPGRSIRLRRKRHAIARALQRWNVHLTIEDVGALNAVIRMGLGRPIERLKRSQKLFVTTLGGIQIPVVYCEKLNSIVTVLPPDAHEVRRALTKRKVRAVA